MQALYQHVLAVFRAQGNPAIAEGQMRYMRNKFEYFGLKMPVWTTLTKQIHQEYGIPQDNDLMELVRLCFQDSHREMHYFALETVQKATKKQQPPHWIDFLEEMITTQSWWDSVDWIRKFVGAHFLHYPEQIEKYTTAWIASENIWLQRMAITFQLKYKHQTDAALLFQIILHLSGSREFFVQKGAGWALREYAKWAPEQVYTFVKSHPLPALTRREALKGIRNI